MTKTKAAISQSVCIGRNNSNDIVLQDLSVSDKHAELSLVNQHTLTFKIEDLASSNGTFKNDQRVKECEFHLGDTIRLANTSLEPAVYLPVFMEIKKTHSTIQELRKPHFSWPSAKALLIIALITYLLSGIIWTEQLFTAEVLLQSLALLSIFLITVYLIQLLIRHWSEFKISRQYHEMMLAQWQSRIEKVAPPPAAPEQRVEHHWSNYRKFEITDKVEECRSMTSFYLTPHDKKAIPNFKPGQYLTFRLQIPGKSKPVIRCYTLSDRYQPDYYRVTIRNMPPPSSQPDAPAGLASSFFHDHLQVGDIVDVQAPSGKFFLDPEQVSAVVFIAGGVGITPMISMMNTLIDAGDKREVWFLLSVPSRIEHPMKSYLQHIDETHDNIHLRVRYSNVSEDDILGKDYHYEGSSNFGQLQEILPSNNYTFYLCGPPPMMMAVHEGLLEWGVPEENIYAEAFGPAMLKPAGDPTAPEDSPDQAQVTFAHSGKTYQWQTQDGSLLDFAEKHGIAIDYGCRSGNCGTCLVALHEGDVCFTSDHDLDPESRSCLTCITIPQTDLTLDA